jgi:hypothetical protein
MILSYQFKTAKIKLRIVFPIALNVSGKCKATWSQLKLCSFLDCCILQVPAPNLDPPPFHGVHLYACFIPEQVLERVPNRQPTYFPHHSKSQWDVYKNRRQYSPVMYVPDLGLCLTSGLAWAWCLFNCTHHLPLLPQISNFYPHCSKCDWEMKGPST